jgi:uncharacterized coiled-coil protein SlyX
MEQHRCVQEQRIRDLETGMAETRVYIKMIKEDVTDIKQSINDIRASPEKQEAKNSIVWQNIIIELIKLAGLCITIIGAMVGVIKIIGK